MKERESQLGGKGIGESDGWDWGEGLGGWMDSGRGEEEAAAPQQGEREREREEKEDWEERRMNPGGLRKDGGSEGRIMERTRED